MIINKIESINCKFTQGPQGDSSRGLDRAVLQKIQILDTCIHTMKSLKYHKSDEKAKDKNCHGKTERQTDTARERVVCTCQIFLTQIHRC